MKYIIGFLILLLCCGTVVADTHIYTPGVYTSNTNELYVWSGSGSVYVTGYARSTQNLEDRNTQTCLQASRVRFYDGALVDEISGYVSDTTCDSNSNPSGVSGSQVMTPTDRVSCGGDWDSFARCRMCDTSYSAYITLIVSIEDPFTVSGTVSCVTNTTLSVKNGSLYYFIGYSGSNTSYSFQVMNNTDYVLTFSDGHYYEFSVSGENVVYNHDGCIYTSYRFEDRCGNLIPDSEGTYVAWLGSSWLSITEFDAPNGILDILNSSADALTVESVTFAGAVRWGIDPAVSGTTYSLQNPDIAWWLKVIVQNASDGTPLNDAMVNINQSCYCADGYFTANKRTVNGVADFNGMSLQDASIHVSKDGYKFLDDNSTGYSATLSCRTNFSGKTWIIKLAPSNSENESEWYEVQNKVTIHFKDVTGTRTSKISDTDASVRLCYENNNTDDEAMTLKFQSSSTHSYYTDEQSYTIPHSEIGYKTILNSYFTPWEYAYRAVIYNSSIYGWNMTIPLTVRNTTKEETLHYQNLTTNLHFYHESDGQIDYRENMVILSVADSNNATLMDIDLEVWKDGALLCYKNLSAFDYTGSYNTYEPTFDYVSGSNYTAKMYGFDRTLLEVRYVHYHGKG